jgi:hypothetical protein
MQQNLSSLCFSIRKFLRTVGGLVRFSFTPVSLQLRHHRACTRISLMRLQLSIIRLSRDVQQIPHLRDILVVSCLANSVARASSIPRLQQRAAAA